MSTLSFSASTAEAKRKDERTVRRDAERGEKVYEEALNLVRGTALDTGSYFTPTTLLMRSISFWRMLLPATPPDWIRESRLNR